MINSGINEELDDFKKIYDNMESLLECYAEEILKKIPKDNIIK